MMNENAIRSEDIVRLIGLLSGKFAQNRDRLIELDAQLGDGDLGIYMAAGMQKAYEAIGQTEDTPGKLLREVGKIFAEEAPSTMGTLIAGAFMAAGRSMDGKELLDAGDIVAVLEQMGDAIMMRGGAKEGEKTILDAMLPAARSARVALEKGKDLNAICAAAKVAATEGMEYAKGLRAIHGRPGYFGEQTIGKYDGGTVVGVLMMEGFFDWVN
jgi:dihydroxyacetone kinase-like protein